MLGRSLRLLTLGEMVQSEQTMQMLLGESETLFVEHKAGIAKGDGYQLAKAMGSFANTLGGWVLIGVQKGSPIPDWEPPRGGFVDAVRQRLEGQLDPLPSFAADVIRFGDLSVGVVRVYESTDTPHILLADGSIVVREPAQDAKLRKRGKYEATPIRSHFELAQLAQRGRLAEENAQLRFGQRKLPFLENSLRLRWAPSAFPSGESKTFTGEGPAVILRAAPLSLSARWREWAVSGLGVDAMRRIATSILSDDADTEAPVPHPTGVAVTAQGTDWVKWVPGGHRSFRRVGTAAVDGGGAIGIRLGFEIVKGSGLVYDWRELADDGELEVILEPLLGALEVALADAEHLGRYLVHLDWLRMGELFRIEPQYEGKGEPPSHLPGGGLLTVDGLGDRTERSELVRRWGEEFLRSSGIAVWR